MDDIHLLKFYLKLRHRQREVLELVCAGLSNDEIGAGLYITSSGVAEHLTTIYAELGNEEAYADRRVNRAVLISAFAPFFARHPEMKQLQ
ncbi:MAG: hypothetical protein IPO91_29210 [Chloroflexi bacterium]|jgi:DNA-binding NarL/FixJ family response regulator|nr:hypothetical protein [Chloroflexota bacterium]